MTRLPEDLCPHPEGGRYREVFRSEHHVDLKDGRNRSHATHIYFHLAAGEVSRFHKVEQEELWNLYQGRLRLWLFDEESKNLQEVTLSPDSACYCHVVPTGVWQAAEPLNGDALAGCTVAPGFDFADFDLMPPEHADVPYLKQKGLTAFIPESQSTPTP